MAKPLAYRPYLRAHIGFRKFEKPVKFFRVLERCIDQQTPIKKYAPALAAMPLADLTSTAEFAVQTEPDRLTAANTPAPRVTKVVTSGPT